MMVNEPVKPNLPSPRLSLSLSPITPVLSNNNNNLPPPAAAAVAKGMDKPVNVAPRSDVDKFYLSCLKTSVF